MTKNRNNGEKNHEKLKNGGKMKKFATKTFFLCGTINKNHQEKN